MLNREQNLVWLAYLCKSQPTEISGTLRAPEDPHEYPQYENPTTFFGLDGHYGGCILPT